MSADYSISSRKRDLYSSSIHAQNSSSIRKAPAPRAQKRGGLVPSQLPCTLPARSRTLQQSKWLPQRICAARERLCWSLARRCARVNNVADAVHYRK
eukprot:2018893-Pleurochrysis_carterae.AAC.1